MSDCFFISRRGFLGSGMALAASPLLARVAPGAESREVLDVGSRLELMVDDFLVDRLEGRTEFRLQHPVPREMALVHDAPWEGSGSGYHSVFQDGKLYRMYYKSWHLDVSQGKLGKSHPGFTCYAESDDGIHWRKPELGLFEFEGSKKNNIVLATGKYGQVNADPSHPAVFKDENPDCLADARYKAIIRSAGPKGLLPFKSADGLHWSPMSDGPVISDGAFDSQNLAFWDPVRGEYRAYFRFFTGGTMGKGIRAIRTCTSPDFLNWTKPVPLEYPGGPEEHLYTNQVKPYYRAPHLFVGFPTRYVERGWSDSMRALPELEHRELRAKAHLRYGTALTEGLLMTSRDGRTFKRWQEAFLRPGIEREGTWHYGQQYIGWHVVETRSAIEGEPNELSLYAGESYWTGTSSALRRYTLRLDGFVSLSAPMSGGQLVTKPLRFQGSRMVMNFSTSAAGGIRVEILDAHGNSIPGFALDDSQEVFGDSLERTVTWKNGGDLSALAGRPVRLRLVLRDADMYSIRFQQ